MNRSGLRLGGTTAMDPFPEGSRTFSLQKILGWLQLAFINFDNVGFSTGAVINFGLLISLFRPPTTNNIQRRYCHMKTKMPMRVRISRFLSERYVQREQPHYLAEFALFGLIVIIALWPMISLASAMQIVR